ncbi:MAG: DUF3857 domain-containing protein [Kiritimatiellae bacterium]|nr:DUF3857 domain-containing protein [Kiritimatiellia bacterium]
MRNYFWRLAALTFLMLQYTLSIEPPEGFMLEREAVMLAARNVTSERFPDADRVLVDNRVMERYEKDGTSVLWDDEFSRVLTEKGRRAASSYQISFSASYGTAFVYRAEIIKPDGKVVSVDLDVYARVMTDTDQMGSNIYDPNNKVLNLSFPGVEIGDVCRLVTCRLTTKTRMPDTWSDYAVFEYDQPIARLEYLISAPPELPLRHIIMRDQITNTFIYASEPQPEGRTLHRWLVTDVPQMFPEPDMPPLHTQVQRLITSTIEDWQTVSRWYWELCQPAMSKTTPEMLHTVEELVKDASTRDDKIRSIFKFVSQKIRYMGITPEDTAPGYEPHAVDLTFNNRYGVCRDKAVLLAAMLKLADIPAYPVLIHAGAKMDPEVPLPFFNHAVTAVDKPGGGYVLMDPTDENARDLFPAYLCNRSYLVARPEGETLLVSEVYPAENNLARIVSDGALDETGALLLKTRIVFEGINDNAYRGHLVRQRAEQRRRFFERAVKGSLAGAEILECQIDPADLQNTEEPLVVALTIRVPDYPVRGNVLDQATVPWLGLVLGYANFVIRQTGLHERRYTLDTGITCGIEESVKLNISAALGEAHVLPQTISIDRSGVQFSMSQTVTGDVLDGTMSYLINSPEFSPPQYLDLKRSLAEIEVASRQKPLFLAKEAFAHDIEVLRKETVTHLASDREWVTTNLLVKRVLTYAGKKNHAELKFNFNPVWQDVEIVSATVSNANGTVHAVTPMEINLMDAGWVGSAPRYAPAKTLVVNLPGVEIGSVITAVTCFRQRNGYFYSHSRAFGGLEPVRLERYSLTFSQDLKPTYKVYNADNLRFSAVTNRTSITLEWGMMEQPVVRSEEYLPPWHFFQPTLYVSFGDWKQHSAELRRAVREISRHSSSARRRAKELVKGIRDPLKRMRIVRDDVLRTIRPAGPPFLDLPANLFSAPDLTLADQYGHPADRALLLAEMLDAVGFEAEVILASSDTTSFEFFSQPQRDLPQLKFYSFPLVAVHHKGRTYYLNDGDQYDEPGVSALDRAPALTLRGKQFTVSVADEMRNSNRSEWIVCLDESGDARITVTNWFAGTRAGPFRKQYQEMLPEDRRRHYLDLINGISKSAQAVSDLVTETESYPPYRSYTVAARRYAAVDTGVLTLTIPEVAGALFPLRSDKREHPLFLSGTTPDTLECRILLPPGYTRLALVPESRNWELPNGLGSLSYDVRSEINDDGRAVVHISRRIERDSGEVPPELYPALLEYNRLSTHPSVRTLVAEKDNRD